MQFKNCVIRPIKIHPIFSQCILFSKGEKTNVGGVMGLIKRGIGLIHHMPLLLTLIVISHHVPIVILIGMMQIIDSHYIQNYNRANQRPLILVKAKVMGQVKRGKTQPIKSCHQIGLKSIQHHGGHIHIVGGVSYKHGGPSKIQCIQVRENKGSKRDFAFQFTC